MKRNVLSKLSMVVAIVCVLAMLPVVSVSAAPLAVEATASMTSGSKTLTDSAASAPEVTKDATFSVKATTDANIEVTVISNLDGNTTDAKIVYINQVNSGTTGIQTFTFTLREGAELGTYIVKVGGEGITPVTKYFKLVNEEASPSKNLTIVTPPSNVVAGKRVTFAGKVEGISDLKVELLSSTGLEITCMGTAIIAGDGYTASLYTNENLAVGTYTVRVSDKADSTVFKTATFVVSKATTSTELRYGDVANSLREPIPDKQINNFDLMVLVEAASKNMTLGGAAAKNGDINGVGGINMVDVMELAQYLVNKNHPLGPK